jgi:hypothetical protein
MSAQPSELSARIIDLFGNPATADPTKLFGNLTVLPSGIVQIGSASGLQLPDGYTTVITPQGRNRIINGDCRIAQRASAVLSSPIGNTYGGPDRFSSANSTGGGQFTQSAGTITFGGATLPAIVLTANTANTAVTGSNYWYGILHQIEASAMTWLASRSQCRSSSVPMLPVHTMCLCGVVLRHIHVYRLSLRWLVYNRLPFRSRQSQPPLHLPQALHLAFNCVSDSSTLVRM